MHKYINEKTDALQITVVTWFINNRNSFLMVLEAGMSKIKALETSITDALLLSGLLIIILLQCPHMVDRGESSLVPIFEIITLIHRLVTSQRLHLLTLYHHMET
jgi:hypothetical protein